MLSQAWCLLINLLHKVNKAKQHSDGMQLERTKARLSNTENKNGSMSACTKDQVKRHRDWTEPGEVTDVEDGGTSQIKTDDLLLLDKNDCATLT
jgi:hypothetical protein